ncbi:MAG: hypothetical protein J3K34DRAFT_228386 [Monoraphidium minutum]|nr:MAG: hypothetical protein J3K34DRAFT_228386 [Monoraphidium minutum]
MQEQALAKTHARAGGRRAGHARPRPLPARGPHARALRRGRGLVTRGAARRRPRQGGHVVSGGAAAGGAPSQRFALSLADCGDVSKQCRDGSGLGGAGVPILKSGGGAKALWGRWGWLEGGPRGARPYCSWGARRGRRRQAAAREGAREVRRGAPRAGRKARGAKGDGWGWSGAGPAARNRPPAGPCGAGAAGGGRRAAGSPWLLRFGPCRAYRLAAAVAARGRGRRDSGRAGGRREAFDGRNSTNARVEGVGRRRGRRPAEACRPRGQIWRTGRGACGAGSAIAHTRGAPMQRAGGFPIQSAAAAAPAAPAAAATAGRGGPAWGGRRVLRRGSPAQQQRGSAEGAEARRAGAPPRLGSGGEMSGGPPGPCARLRGPRARSRARGRRRWARGGRRRAAGDARPAALQRVPCGKRRGWTGMSGGGGAVPNT